MCCRKTDGEMLSQFQIYGEGVLLKM